MQLEKFRQWEYEYELGVAEQFMRVQRYYV